MAPRIFISAGEASGDMYAAQLAAALRERTGAELFGMGGPRMREAGVELVAESNEVTLVGFGEIVSRLPSLLRVFRRLEKEVKRRKPDLAVLVDFPGFHLNLAQRLRGQGVRIVYFISPQVWAWRQWRVKRIKRLVERMLCIFPFEEQFYRDAGVPVDFVGHPLVDSVRSTTDRTELLKQLDLDAGDPLVALLPGSRPSEVSRLFPVMTRAARELIRAAPGNWGFVVAAAPGITRSELDPLAADNPLMYCVSNATYDVLAAADVAIVASGTATVEAALLGTPMVVVYRVSRSTAAIARRLVKTPHFAMVNLIAGRRVVPELMQENFTPEAVAREVKRLLDSAEAREQMKRDLAEVRAKLGPGGAIGRAAGIIAGVL